MLIKAFRLFVSSTFADFAAERGILQKRVFPALDVYCAAKGYQFYPIDLRWGVNEEAQLDQRTAEICLDEVRAAKADYPPPNFLIMIGSRYGFVPLPYAIARDEFAAIVGWLEGQDKRGAADVLRAVYRRDDNYLVPRGLAGDERAGDRFVVAFTLRSRVDELTEFRAADAWAEREAQLRASLQEAADGLLAQGRIDAAVHEKYFLSLTDQEIVLGLPGYKRPADARSGTDDDGPQAIAFIREIAAPSGPPPAMLRHYFEQSPRLEQLRAGIRRALPADHVVTARADVDENGRLSAAYLANFAAQIEEKLQAAIDRSIARVETLERAPDHALESERAAHRAFAEQKQEIFVGRADTLASIARYLTDGSDQPLVVHGRSGFGKSAVIARAIADAEATRRKPVIARFVGASAASSNLRALLTSLVDDLAAHRFLEKPAEYEQETNKFSAQVASLLSSISGPTVIFLDALDQLQKPCDLNWLPAKLQERVRLVLSVLEDPAYPSESEICRDLRNRLTPDAFLEVGPLGVANGRDVLSALEQQTRHRLQDGQRDYIIEKYDNAGGSPLYLKTAFDIARSWKSHHVAGVGRCVLAEDTDAVIAQFIAELSSVQHHEPELVARTLGYIAAAKDGLSAKELADILSSDAGVMRAISSERFGAQTDRLPPAVWLRLYRDLSPFLVEKQIDEQPLLQFFHRQVAGIARARHYEGVKTELHATLAAYFETQASEKARRRIYAKRSLSELPHQYHHADNAARLRQILMSPDWMQQKLDAFGLRPLVDDYQYARSRAEVLTGQALGLAAGPLGRDPRQLAAQLLGRLSPDLVDDPAECAQIESLLHDVRTFITPPAFVPRWPRLTAPGGAEIRRFGGDIGEVGAVAFSPDGRYIASGSTDRTLRLWEAASGREIRRFQGHDWSVNAVAFSTDGRHIVSGSGDHTLRLWEVTTGREIRRFQGHDRGVNAVAFSADGLQIVSGSNDTTLRVWDAASGRQIRCFEGHRPRDEDVAFSIDGRYLVSGSESAIGGSRRTLRLWEVASGREILQGATGDCLKSFSGLKAIAVSLDGRHIVHDSGDYSNKTLSLWDVASGREIRRFEGHRWGAKSVAFSPDGQHIVSGSGDLTVRLWEVATGRELGCFKSHTGEVTAVAFSPDGQCIASGSEDKTVRVWEMASGRQMCCLEGHTDVVQAVSFSPDGRHIVSGAESRTEQGALRLWDVASGREIRRFESYSVKAIAFSPDGRRIVSRSYGSVRLWDVATGREIRSLESQAGRVLAVAFSPDGQHIVSSSEDETLQTWEVATGRETSRLHLSQGHSSEVHAVAVSPDGRHIASGSSDATLRLWEIATGHEIRRFEGHISDSIAFSPDGQHIVSCSGGLRLWELATGRDIRRFEGPSGSVNAVAFSPDGQHIVTGSGGKYIDPENTVRVWEAASGRQISRFEGHTDEVHAVAFSADGRHIVSGSDDQTIRLWDATGAGEIRRARDHTDIVEVVAFSPDGRHIASSSRDKTLRLWEATTGREIRRLEGHTDVVQAVAFSHDGQQILSGSKDKTLRLWEVATGREIRRFADYDSLLSRHAALSPDARLVASVSDNRTLLLWHVESGRWLRQIRRFEGHVGLPPVAFSPDGRKIVSGSDDHKLWLWDVASGHAIRCFEGHTSSLTSVAFTPDGRHVVSSSEDNTVRLWEVERGREIRCFEGDSGFPCLAIMPSGTSLAAGDRGGHVHLLDILVDGDDKAMPPDEHVMIPWDPTRFGVGPWYTMHVLEAAGGDTEFTCRRCKDSVEITPRRGEQPPEKCPSCQLEAALAFIPAASIN